jgi:hypothetical protein
MQHPQQRLIGGFALGFSGEHILVFGGHSGLESVLLSLFAPDMEDILLFLLLGLQLGLAAGLGRGDLFLKTSDFPEQLIDLALVLLGRNQACPWQSGKRLFLFGQLMVCGLGIGDGLLQTGPLLLGKFVPASFRAIITGDGRPSRDLSVAPLSRNRFVRRAQGIAAFGTRSVNILREHRRLPHRQRLTCKRSVTGLPCTGKSCSWRL